MRNPFLGMLCFPTLRGFMSWLTRRLDAQPQSCPEAEMQQIEALTPRHKPHRACELRDLSNRLSQRYTASGNLDDLEAAIKHLKTALEMTAVLDNALRGDLFGNLSDQFDERFRLLGRLDDLGKAIESLESSISTTSAEHPRLVERLEKLSLLFNTRYELLEDSDDIEAAIQYVQAALNTTSTPIDNPSREIMLSKSFHNQYERLGSLADLEASIKHLETAVLATAEDDPYRAIMLYHLSVFILSRYKHVQELPDLEAALGYLRSSLAAIPGDHPTRLIMLDIMGSSLETRYERLGDPKDLDMAIKHIQDAIASTPAANHHERGCRLNELSTVQFIRYQELAKTADLEAAIEHMNQAFLAFHTSGNLSGLPKLLTNLSIFLLARYKLLADPGDLDGSIKQSQAAIKCMGETNLGHPDRPGVLVNLSAALISRYEMTKELGDLDAAIENVEAALETTPEGHYDRPGMLSNLGLYLRTRYERLGTGMDLDKAIKHTGEALAETPAGGGGGGGGGEAAGYRARARYVLALCWLLRTRSGKPNCSDNLTTAISLAETMLSEISPLHPDRPELLHCLSISFGFRYNQHQSPSDLDLAAAHIKEALASTPNALPDRAIGLNHLSAIIIARYTRTGVVTDLRDAIKHVEEALDSMPEDDASRGSTLTNLSSLLHFQHRRLRAVTDLNAAIGHAESALRFTPLNHPDYTSRLRNMSAILHARFDRLGYSDDLESAIRLMQDCLKRTPVRHAERTRTLIDLGGLLRCKFRRFGTSDGLEAAVEYVMAAVDETPAADPDHGRIMSNLRSLLVCRDRRKKLSTPPELEAAIKRCETTLTATSPTHHSRLAVLFELGNCFISQFSVSEALCDIDVAIGHIEAALAAIPHDHFNRAVMLDRLGNCFRIRYENLNDIGDLNMAIDHEQASVLATPVGDPSRAHSLTCLGRDLRLRYSCLNSEHDRTRSFECFLEVWNCQTEPPLVRVQAVWRAAEFFQSCQTWEQSSLLFEDAIKLLPKMSLGSLGRDNRQRVLSSLDGLSSLAASFALQTGRSPYEALQLLELGRGIITGFALDSQSEMSDLQETHSDLSESLNALRAEANSAPPENLGDLAQLRVNRMRALDQIDVVLASIREIPAYKDFLLMPCQTDLMKLAEHGTIVVMITTSLRSDAIIITTSAIRSISLPKLVYKTAKQKMREMSANFTGTPETLGPRNTAMRRLLSWLWDSAVEPVLEELDSKTSRVWWIGTGELSRAPFHAAGYHEKGSSRYTMSRVVSSYIPAVKALSYARQRNFNPVSKSDPRLLLPTITPLHPPSTEPHDETTHPGSAFQLAGFTDMLDTLWQPQDEACKTVAEVFHASLSDDGNSADSHAIISSALHKAVKMVREGNLDRPLTWAPFIYTGDGG